MNLQKDIERKKERPKREKDKLTAYSTIFGITKMACNQLTSYIPNEDAFGHNQ